MSTPRDRVYQAIDSERTYQDFFIETNPERCAQDAPDHSVGDYLTMLTTYLREAQDSWTKTAGDAACLHQVRKIAGIAVHCMEDHGAPPREFEETNA